jgi:Spy/CpxP family protein refolding chaperone
MMAEQETAMKRTVMGAALMAAGLLAVPAIAQMGYGPGYGMMGGYGMHGAMMGAGFGARDFESLKLSDEQRTKLADIERDVSQKQWEVMKRMHDQPFHMHDAYASGELDENVARKSYDAMSAAQKEMFEIGLQARKRIDSVLTPEQRQQLRGTR